MKDIFLPPGVQMKLWQKLGHCPRQASVIVSEQIEALWRERNTAPEQELDRIDREMQDLVMHGERCNLERAQDTGDRSAPYVNPID